jgi:conjugative relaxase-like TrwC/TraI family protein
MLYALTIPPGDYYLTPDGEPTQAPGRWLATPETLARLGIDGERVEGEDFVALMEGRHPGTGRWLRREGAGGGRGGGIDVVFSPPKSVSAVWALGDEQQRAEMEAAHAAAVDLAMAHLRETVPAVRRRYGAGVVEEPAVDLVAAEYRHTTSRGVFGTDVPDPQLHSHVVITSAVRDDGRVVAVASRPIFRTAREVGAYYRSALAGELQDRRYGIEAGTGKDGRYFEIEGVPVGLREAFSARSREVAREAERFRARHGREPERRELREIVVRTRSAKRPVTRQDLQRAWDETAARYRFTGNEPQAHRERGERGVDGSLRERVEVRLTEHAAPRRHCHRQPRCDRRLADQQGARLRQRLQSPQRHRLVHQPHRPRKTTTASAASRNECATAAPRSRPSRTRSYPTPSGDCTPASTGRPAARCWRTCPGSSSAWLRRCPGARTVSQRFNGNISSNLSLYRSV